MQNVFLHTSMALREKMPASASRPFVVFCIPVREKTVTDSPCASTSWFLLMNSLYTMKINMSMFFGKK